MARNLYEYDNNGLARAYEDCKWTLFDRDGNQVGEWYSYIEEWGEGFYKIEQGAKKNIMRPDGSVVLKAWHNDVFRVRHGFFLFSNTIRKSKANPKTRYVHGLAHVNGDVIFPMIFDHAEWLEDGDEIYAETDSKPYILTLGGSVYDPALGHLPKKINVDYKTLFEKFVNWTFPGLQFFYRDTDAPVAIDTTYHVGDVLRAGFFVDVTTKLCRPVHRTRFLIASAHAAMLCETGELCEENPDIKKWNLCTLHFNSYFKVMDIYEKDGVTQVFLLHIPAAAAFFIGHDETAMDFVNEATGKELSLIDMARKSLDDKMLMEVHPRSLDKEFCERTYRPVGLDDEFYPMPLDAADEPTEGALATLSNVVHKLANDADIQDFIHVEDNFPYQGVEGSVCEGCIYANGIQGHGEGCGRLFIKSFRERYLKGLCEYHKTELDKPSRFEEMDKYRKKEEKERAEKSADTFALRVVRRFVDEYLDGDINKLAHTDLYAFKADTDDDTELTGENVIHSVMALVFSDSWPGLTVQNIEQYNFCCSMMNEDIRLTGSNIADQYMMGLQKFCPSKELNERAIRTNHLLQTIGNFWVLPNNRNDKDTLSNYKDTTPHYRGYMDKYLKAIYAAITGHGKVDTRMKGILYKNRKLMNGYQGLEGFNLFVHNMMLDDYVDEQGMPKNIFPMVWSYMKGLNRDTYLCAVSIFCDFCEYAIPRRSQRIIGKLSKTLKSNR